MNLPSLKNKTTFFLSLFLAFTLLFSDFAVGAEGWKTEFERISGYSMAAADLSTQQLEKLISDCDSLLPQFNTLKKGQKKLYTFRLNKCRNFYQYLLQIREQSPKQGEPADNTP